MLQLARWLGTQDDRKGTGLTARCPPKDQTQCTFTYTTTRRYDNRTWTSRKHIAGRGLHLQESLMRCTAMSSAHCKILHLAANEDTLWELGTSILQRVLGLLLPVLKDCSSGIEQVILVPVPRQSLQTTGEPRGGRIQSRLVPMLKSGLQQPWAATQNVPRGHTLLISTSFRPGWP